MILKPERLNGVHPDLGRLVARAAELAPWDLMILEGLRSISRQQMLFDQKASRTLHSKHLVQPDGMGHAIDVAPVLDIDGDGDREASWHWPHYNELAVYMKRAAAELGIRVRWGGDWESFRDGPHWELVP